VVSLSWHTDGLIFSTFSYKVSNRIKYKISRFFFDCTELQVSEISRCVSFTTDLKHKLEKRKELTEMELVADTDSHAYKIAAWTIIK
jgi:hypothetical protein